MNHHRVAGNLLCVFVIAWPILAAEKIPHIPTPAEQYVESALEFEAGGQAGMRKIMLERALKVAPSYPPANWHSGRVRGGDNWVSIAEFQHLASTNETLAQYRELRERAGDDPKRHLTLARWCARVKDPERSKLHYAMLLQNPKSDMRTRQEAMKKLELRQVGGTLVTEKQIRERSEAAELIKNAMKKWRPRLADLQKTLSSDNKKKQQIAAKHLEAIDDPHIVPVTETFIYVSGPQFGEYLVRLIGRFDKYEATQTLVRFSVLSTWPNVRELAIGQLKLRPLHEYVPHLLDGLASPIQSQWQITRDAYNNIRYRHFLFREGRNDNQAVADDQLALRMLEPRIVGKNVYDTTRRVPRHAALERAGSPYDPNFKSVSTRKRGLVDWQQSNEKQLFVLGAYLQAMSREQQLSSHNAATKYANDLVFHVLEETTAAVILRDERDWWAWWEKYNETVSAKPTRFLYQPSVTPYHDYTAAQQYQRETVQGRHINYPRPRYKPRFSSADPRLRYSFRSPFSCFVGSTKVWAETGVVTIAEVKIGDRVLAQDPNSGELSFKLVVYTTLRPPSPLTRIDIAGEDIFATKGHPLWVVNEGWRMAKLLQKDDHVHGVNGGLNIDDIELLKIDQAAHNLVVADFATYFVGEVGILVHDNTYRKPTRAIVPGLLAE